MTCWCAVVQELERFNGLTERMQRSLATLRRALAGEVGMSNELDELARSIYNGTLPDSWRRFTPATLKSLGNWINYHIDRHAQYYTWVHEREPQVPDTQTHHIDLHTHTHSTTPGYTNENHRYRTDRHTISTYIDYTAMCSHARTVVRECCKGDDESQWERVKFDPPPPKNPLTDGHQNLRT